MVRFSQLDTTLFSGHHLFVDVDGTMVRDGEPLSDESVCTVLRQLAIANSVYITSNGGHEERDRDIASVTHATYFTSRARKPFTRFFFLFRTQEKVVVIGDKCITDGLFALSLGASFIKVERIQAHKRKMSQVLIEYIDDCVWTFFLILKSVRPLQHARNLLIFAPLFFAGASFDRELFYTALQACITFTLLVCAVYIGNDLYDLASDRAHPKKRFRPIASGELKKRFAFFLVGGFLCASFLFAYLFVPVIAPLLIAYLVLNVWYTLSLKHMVVADIVLVASLYLLRIEVGGVATGIPLSKWLILTTFFLALFFVIGKRYAEVSGSATRKVSRIYTQSYLNILLTLSATAALMSYSVYCILGTKSEAMLYSVVPVVVALFRYLFLLQIGGTGESPERIIFRDPVVIFSVIVWGILAGIGVYL